MIRLPNKGQNSNGGTRQNFNVLLKSHPRLSSLGLLRVFLSVMLTSQTPGILYQVHFLTCDRLEGPHSRFNGMALRLHTTSAYTQLVEPRFRPMAKFRCREAISAAFVVLWLVTRNPPHSLRKIFSSPFEGRRAKWESREAILSSGEIHPSVYSTHYSWLHFQ